MQTNSMKIDSCLPSSFSSAKIVDFPFQGVSLPRRRIGKLDELSVHSRKPP